MKTPNLLVSGKLKLDKSIYTFSIPHIITCPNHSQCSTNCYAVKCYEAYDQAKTIWDRNYELSKDTYNFSRSITSEIKRRKIKTVRIHVSGDYYNRTYLESWRLIAYYNPKTFFYGYSRCFDIMNLENFNNFHNVNIVNSILPDGYSNFGTAPYIARKSWELDIPICPVTAKRKWARCGDTCTMCHTHSHMLFVKH